MEDLKDFVIWGNGDTNNIFNQRKYKVISELSKKSHIEKIYLNGDVALYVTNGELIKEGKFEFEKKLKNYNNNNNNNYINEDINNNTNNIKTSSLNNKNNLDLTNNELNNNENLKNIQNNYLQKTVIYFKVNSILVQPIVSQISFGTNHVVIMSIQGQVFTWGQNYYGQLGLANYFLIMSKEPNYVSKISELAATVLAYENSSFCISTNKKLWVWGHSKYLGNAFNCNIFKPFMSHSNYIFHKLKINNNGTFIAKTSTTHEYANLNNVNLNNNFSNNKKEDKHNSSVKKDKINDANDEAGNEGYILSCIKSADNIVRNLIEKYYTNALLVENIKKMITE